MNRPIITPMRLDQMLDPGAGSRRSSLAIESLWGASNIAKFMGVSDDFVRKAALDPSCPIRRRVGRYFVTKTELTAWLLPNSEEVA